MRDADFMSVKSSRPRGAAVLASLSVVIFLLVGVFSANAAIYVTTLSKAHSREIEKVAVQIGVDTEGQKLNLFNVTVPLPEGLEFISADLSDSVINVWIKEAKYNADLRTFNFIGGVPGGTTGRVALAKFYVRAKESGRYDLAVSADSEAYVNDGLGTRAAVRSAGATLASRRIIPSILAWAGSLAGVLAVVAALVWLARRRRAKSAPAPG